MGIFSAIVTASRQPASKAAAPRRLPYLLGAALSVLASNAFAQSLPAPSNLSIMGTLGGMNYSGSGSMSGTDTTAVPPTTTQSQSLNHTTLAGGASAELPLLWQYVSALSQGCSAAVQAGTASSTQYQNCENVEEALVIGADDPGRATASFSGLSAIPAGTGTSFLKESWSIPVALSFRVPASALGVKVPGLSFSVRGGVAFDEWKAGFNLIELGAPGGPPTSASKTYWSADPLVGVGSRYYLDRHWFTGVDATWTFARSESVSAPSANFAPLESYTLNTGSHTLTAVMFNLGYTFGADSPPSSAPMVTKAR